MFLPLGDSTARRQLEYIQSIYDVDMSNVLICRSTTLVFVLKLFCLHFININPTLLRSSTAQCWVHSAEWLLHWRSSLLLLETTMRAVRLTVVGLRIKTTNQKLLKLCRVVPLIEQIGVSSGRRQKSSPHRWSRSSFSSIHSLFLLLLTSSSFLCCVWLDVVTDACSVLYAGGYLLLCSAPYLFTIKAIPPNSYYKWLS